MIVSMMITVEVTDTETIRDLVFQVNKTLDILREDELVSTTTTFTTVTLDGIGYYWGKNKNGKWQLIPIED